MRSMTGYGDKLIAQDGLEVFIQIKTLNHRFLSVDISSSEEIPWKWEQEIEKKIRGKISRGKVVVDLKVKRKSADFIQIEPNFELANSYFKALKDLSRTLNLREGVKLSHLLDIPDVMRVERKQQRKMEEVIRKGIDEVLARVIKTREKEGGKHLENILGSVDAITNAIQFIEKEAPSVKKKYREKMQEELEDILPQKKASLSGQVTLPIDKGNIEEEIVRFNSHLTQLDQILHQQGPIGKKLKFVLQELQREINTIGAKSLSPDISRKVVEIKDGLENIREQIYNIE